MGLGVSFGLGGRGNAYAGTAPGGSVGSGAVFSSPITPDLASTGPDPQEHPATWILVGCAVWIFVVGVHFYHY